MSEVNWPAFILINAVLLAAYFLPTIIGAVSRHRQVAAIFALNLFLGWTLLGWVLALVWAMMDDKKPPAAVEERAFSFTYRGQTVIVDRQSQRATVGPHTFADSEAAKTFIDRQA